ISVPRLFALILGDVKVAEMIIALHLSGELAGLTPQEGARELVAIPAEDLRTATGGLANHIIRKLLPPAQIFRRKSMTIAEALYSCPVRAGAGGARLLKLLTRCPVSLNTSHATDGPASLLPVEEFDLDGRKRVLAATNLGEFLFLPAAAPPSSETN